MKSTNHQQYKKQQLTRTASLKIVRKRLHWFVIVIIVLAISAAATVAFAVTPVNGGSVGGSTIVVDNTAGDQVDSHVSGNLVSNTLFRVTDTPFTNESLNDVTVLANGDVRAVWAADDDVLAGARNVYARTFTLPGTPSFQVCLLYDPLVARKSGTAYPIKLQLCDANGQNLSSSSIVLHAVSVTQASTNAPGPLDDTGNANPDFDFRYDATLGGTGGYIFNLSLRGFPTGTHKLNFRAGTDPALHSAPFAVK